MSYEKFQDRDALPDWAQKKGDALYAKIQQQCRSLGQDNLESVIKQIEIGTIPPAEVADVERNLHALFTLVEKEMISMIDWRHVSLVKLFGMEFLRNAEESFRAINQIQTLSSGGLIVGFTSTKESPRQIIHGVWAIDRDKSQRKRLPNDTFNYSNILGVTSDDHVIIERIDRKNGENEKRWIIWNPKYETTEELPFVVPDIPNRRNCYDPQTNTLINLGYLPFSKEIEFIRYDIDTREVIETSSLPKDLGGSLLSITPDGLIIFSSSNVSASGAKTTIRIVNLDSQVIAQMPAVEGNITAATQLPNKIIAYLNENGTRREVWIWNVATNQQIKLTNIRSDGAFHATQILGESRYVLTLDGDRLIAFDVEDGHPVWNFPCSQNALDSTSKNIQLCCSPRGEIILGQKSEIKIFGEKD